MEDRTGYLGFTYNGKHSSEFNIVRTSDGSRFNQNLLPTIQDKTVQIPGAPGRIFQRADYDTKVFSIQIAYDEMSEQNMQEMRRWLGDKKIHPLIFDELPYKTWYAKVTGTASMKWIPFSEGQTNRTYKGEGTIQFTCYDPFAHCNCDWFSGLGISNYEQASVEQKEWLNSSRLLETVGKNSTLVNRLTIDENGNLTTTDGNIFNLTDSNLELSENFLDIKYGLLVYLTRATKSDWLPIFNCGDTDTGFKLLLNFINTGDVENSDFNIPQGGLYLGLKKTEGATTWIEVIGGIEWKKIEKIGTDSAVVINSKMNLIEGIRDTKKSGNIYDHCIVSGAYFTLPEEESFLFPLFFDESGNQIEGDDLSAILGDIDFDYLYL